MTLPDYLFWLIEFAALYARKTAASHLPQVQANAAGYTAQWHALRAVQQHIDAPLMLSDVGRVWHSWVMDTAGTYANNARENEAENNRARMAATIKRDEALMALERRAA